MLAHVFWHAKPAGMSYADVPVWQRQMVLGPAPEYAVHARDATVDVDGLHVVHASLTAGEPVRIPKPEGPASPRRRRLEPAVVRAERPGRRVHIAITGPERERPESPSNGAA